MILEGFRHSSGANSVRGSRGKTRFLRTTYYVVLGIALVLATATLSMVSPPRAYAASAAFVQGRNAQVTKGTTASLAFSKANTAGDLIVVYVVLDNTGTVTVSDSNGNNYTAATAQQSFGGSWSAQVFYASGILGGTNTVKVTFSKAITSFGLVYLHEYSGLATATPVDVSASAAGTSTAMSTGVATTTQANDLLFAAGASANTVTAGTTGFTTRLNGFGNLTEDRVVTTTGSYVATGSQNGSSWVMQLVAFRLASSVIGPSAKLGFVQGPSTTAAGAAMTPAVTVAVEDASGNVETSDNATQVSLALGANPGAGTLSGGSALTVKAGIATFSGLSINTPGTGYTLTASSTPAFTGATSASFNITGVGPSAKLGFVQGPSTTAAGAAMTPAVTVAVEDASGNVETSDNATQVSLALGANPGAGTLSGGSALTVKAGIATFSGLSINTPGTGYTLTASSTPAFTGVTSASFNITGVGPSAKLGFVQGPSTTAAGAAMTPAVTVAVEDASGNVETSDNATQVSLALGANPGAGTLSGGSALTVKAGIATFSGLSINTPGTGYTLTASSTPAFTGVTSASFNITGVGPSAKLGFVQGPSTTAAGAAMTPAVTVAVEDASGNVETSDNATQVSLALGANPGAGTLSGGSALTVKAGIATFSGLSINTPGTGYTLTASSTPAFTGVTSASFTITTPGTSSAWTTYLQGSDRAGFTAGSELNQTSAPNLSLAWKTSDAGPAHGVFSQPIVSNGLVYWGSFDGYERATDTSGKLVWQTFLGTSSPPACTNPSSAGIASTGTVTTDVPVGTATSVLYVGGGNSVLYALNAATGAVLWSYYVGNSPNTFLWDSPLVFGNSVYIGVASFGDCPLVQGQLLQLNRVTGALQNTFDVVPNGCDGGGIWDSPTLDAAAGTIYFDTGTPADNCPSTPGGPSVYEVRASDLSLVGSWTIPVAQQLGDPDFGATPTLFTGIIGGQSEPLVGVINKNGLFYAFKRDALAAGPVWTTRIAEGGADPTVGAGDIASAAFDGTTLYVGGDATATCTGTVNALNPASGATIWQHCFTDGGFVMGAVTGTSGGVVAVGEGKNIAVLSATSGASLYTFTGTGPFWAHPPSRATRCTKATCRATFTLLRRRTRPRHSICYRSTRRRLRLIRARLACHFSRTRATSTLSLSASVIPLQRSPR